MARRVALFVPCVVDRFAPHVAIATARILRHLGIEVDAPTGQTCCGQPALNAGYPDEAATVAAAWLDRFADADAVVAPSGSCVAFLTRHVTDLPLDPPHRDRATTLDGRVHEFTAFVTDVLHRPSLGGRFEGRVAWHPSCHALRDLGIDRAAEGLIAGIDGVELVPVDDRTECCGFGGTFAVDLPALSARMAADKCAAFEAAGAEWVVSADLSCLLHLDGWLRRHGRPVRTMHVAELLAHALGLGDGLDATA